MSAAVDTAWCFMLRSREYLAVPEKGSNPMRWGQIVFRNERGDEVRGTEVGMAERITLRLPSYEERSWPSHSLGEEDK